MQKSTKLGFIFFVMMITNTIFAAGTPQTGLSLYDQPDNKGKIIATIATGQPLIPIFNQGDWVKVADPSNGNVGWVNKNTLTTQGYPTFYLKTYGNNGKNQGVQGYQIMQYSGAEGIDQKQMNDMMKNFQAQQKQMEQLMRQNLSELNQVWGSQPMVMPVLQPIILVPQKAPQTQSVPTPKKAP